MYKVPDSLPRLYFTYKLGKKIKKGRIGMGKKIKFDGTLYRKQILFKPFKKGGNLGRVGGLR